MRAEGAYAHSALALDSTELERRRPSASRPLPDWTKIREELAPRRDHQVTLALLWTEYKGRGNCD
jgi:hypothetical protein